MAELNITELEEMSDELDSFESTNKRYLYKYFFTKNGGNEILENVDVKARIKLLNNIDEVKELAEKIKALDERVSANDTGDKSVVQRIETLESTVDADNKLLNNDLKDKVYTLDSSKNDYKVADESIINSIKELTQEKNENIELINQKISDTNKSILSNKTDITDIKSNIETINENLGSLHNYDDSEIRQLISSINDSINIINGNSEDTGSILNIVSTEIAKLIADAPEQFDILKEIAEFISSEAESAIELKNSVDKISSDYLKHEDVSEFVTKEDITQGKFSIVSSNIGYGQVTNKKVWDATYFVDLGTNIVNSFDIIDDLYIKAETSKFSTNERTTDIQITSGTIIGIPYYGDGEVNFNFYPGYWSEISSDYTTVSRVDNTVTGKISNANTVSLNGMKYVLFNFNDGNSSSSYLLNINYTYDEISNIQFKADKNKVQIRDLEILGSLKTGIRTSTISKQWKATDFSDKIESVESTWNDLIIDASNGGKFVTNGSGWIQVNSPIYIYVPFDGLEGYISISTYNAGLNIQYGAGKIVTSNSNTLTFNIQKSDIEYKYNSPYIKILVSSSNYISSISINYTKKDYSVQIGDGDESTFNIINANKLSLIDSVDSQKLDITNTEIIAYSNKGKNKIKFEEDGICIDQELYHGRTSRNDDLSGQMVPYFKLLTQLEYESITKDPNVIYLIKR